MGIQKLSDQLVELGVRMADVADAAQGRRNRRRTIGRWLFLPMAGAGLYALGRSDSFARQARGVVDDAKARAAELPDDLLSRVRQTTQASASNGRASTRRSTSRRRTKASRSTTSR